jgi:hypothetical protein
MVPLPSTLSSSRLHLATLVVVAAVGLLTLPLRFYPGDPVAVRSMAWRLAYTGELGFPYAEKALLPGGLQSDTVGYLYANDAKGRYFSRWGEVATVVFAIPFLLDRAMGGQATGAVPLEGRPLLLHDLMNVLLALLVAHAFFVVAVAVGASPPAAMFFTLLSMYASFVWFFLRAQTTELLLMAAMAVLVPALVRHQKTGQLPPLLLAAFMLVLLANIKTYFLLWFAPLGLFTLLAPPGQRRARDPAAVVGMAALSVALVLLSNLSKFEHPLRTGIGTTRPDDPPTFLVARYPMAFVDYMLDPHISIWWCHPILLLAAPGWIAFWRNQKQLATFFTVATLLFSLMVGAYYIHTGQWTYGPRYLLPVLPWLGLPAALGLDRMWQARHQWSVRVSAAAGVVFLAWFLNLQFTVHRLPFYATHRILGFFRQTLPSRHPEVEQYFQNRAPALMVQDYLGYMTQDAPFYPLEVVAASKDGATQQAVATIHQKLRALYVSNMRFVDLPPMSARELAQP